MACRGCQPASYSRRETQAAFQATAPLPSRLGSVWPRAAPRPPLLMSPPGSTLVVAASQNLTALARISRPSQDRPAPHAGPPPNAPGGIRTPDHRIRNPMLCPTELRAPTAFRQGSPPIRRRRTADPASPNGAPVFYRPRPSREAAPACGLALKRSPARHVAAHSRRRRRRTRLLRGWEPGGGHRGVGGRLCWGAPATARFD